MIDWWMVIAHAAWIGGAAMVVASWSLRRRLGSFWDACGATIFCLGWAATSSWWAAIIWLMMPLLWLRRISASPRSAPTGRARPAPEAFR
jgi:hypothetical protein